jgi:hypothetical protein
MEYRRVASVRSQKRHDHAESSSVPGTGTNAATSHAAVSTRRAKTEACRRPGHAETEPESCRLSLTLVPKKRVGRGVAFSGLST